LNFEIETTIFQNKRRSIRISLPEFKRHCYETFLCNRY